MENFKTKHEFIMTGRFMDAQKFTAERPDVKLHADCTDVVVYAGGHYIQSIKTGEYLVRGDFSEHTVFFGTATLSEAEDKLWEEYFKKY